MERLELLTAEHRRLFDADLLFPALSSIGWPTVTVTNSSHRAWARVYRQSRNIHRWRQGFGDVTLGLESPQDAQVFLTYTIFVFFLILALRVPSPIGRLKRYYVQRVLPALGLASKVRIYMHDRPAAVGSVGLDELVKERCPRLGGDEAVFVPTPWLLNGHAHTIYCTVPNFDKIDRIYYERHTVRVPDGGTLALDFTTPLPPKGSRDPMLVVLHGLTGGSHESYVRSVLAAMIGPKQQGGMGWHAVVVNFRGCAGVELTSRKLYHAGQTDDLRHALLYLSSRFPCTPLYGIGFSLGANSLAKYLGEEGTDTPLNGACVLGNPWNLHGGHALLESSWIGRVYSRAMAGNLRRMLSRHLKTFEGSTILDKEAVYANKNQSLYEFDSIVTRQLGGFPSTEEYYRSQSSYRRLDGVRVPLLALNAEDDGIASAACVPRDAPRRNPYLVVATTQHGGHLGWFEGFWTPRRWIRFPVADWFCALHEADPAARTHPGLPVVGVSTTRSRWFPLPTWAGVASPEIPEVGDVMKYDRRRPDLGFRLVKIGALEGGMPGEVGADGTAAGDGMIRGL